VQFSSITVVYVQDIKEYSKIMNFYGKPSASGKNPKLARATETMQVATITQAECAIMGAIKMQTSANLADVQRKIDAQFTKITSVQRTVTDLHPGIAKEANNIMRKK
jgi:hypothetical protein